MVELLVVLVILGILSSISFFAYGNYVNKARLTVAVSALETLRLTLENFHIDYGGYPADIDFSTGEDDLGRAVFDNQFALQLGDDLFAIDSYNSAGLGYTLFARANNRQRTLLKMVPEITIIQD